MDRLRPSGVASILAIVSVLQDEECKAMANLPMLRDIQTFSSCRDLFRVKPREVRNTVNLVKDNLVLQSTINPSLAALLREQFDRKVLGNGDQEVVFQPFVEANKNMLSASPRGQPLPVLRPFPPSGQPTTLEAAVLCAQKMWAEVVAAHSLGGAAFGTKVNAVSALLHMAHATVSSPIFQTPHGRMMLNQSPSIAHAFLVIDAELSQDEWEYILSMRFRARNHPSTPFSR